MSLSDKIKNALPKGLADQIFEDEPIVYTNLPQKESPVPVLGRSSIAVLAAPEPVFQPMSSDNTLSGASGVASSNNPFLNSLKSKIDFDSTEAGKQIAEYMALFADLPLNESQKMSGVLKAGAKAGLTSEKIIATLSAMLTNLTTEEEKFKSSITKIAAETIDSKKEAIQIEADTIKNLEAQITDSRAKQSELTTQLVTAQGNLDMKRMQFSAAIDQSRSELQTTINHYNTILKG